MREQLTKEGCTKFLVFLDSNGRQTTTIQNGLWCQATEQEIVEQSKQHFENVCQKCFGVERQGPKESQSNLQQSHQNGHLPPYS